MLDSKTLLRQMASEMEAVGLPASADAVMSMTHTCSTRVCNRQLLWFASVPTSVSGLWPSDAWQQTALPLVVKLRMLGETL